MPASILVPLDALHIAHATTDIVEGRRDALAPTLARLMAEEHAVPVPVNVAEELISLLLTLASSLTAVPWDSSTVLRHAAEDETFRRAAERAFHQACSVELATLAPEMVGRAWTELLRAYLGWLAALE